MDFVANHILSPNLLTIEEIATTHTLAPKDEANIKPFLVDKLFPIVVIKKKPPNNMALMGRILAAPFYSAAMAAYVLWQTIIK